jgi:tetratricopeptide (TPR) repeat protein
MVANPTKGRSGLAQRWQWPEKAENLKVLPEDTGPEVLSATMRGFAFALGVRCEHCHDDTNGSRLDQLDFPADTKETKEIARIMMQMVRRINGDELSELDEERPERVQVACVTCHRGVSIPRMLEDVLAEVIDTEGIDAGIARYHELREEYYGGFSYDFGEGTLMSLADDLARQEKTDEAFAILDLNLEMFPDSWRTHVGIGRLHQELGHTEEAIAHIEKALELNPDNRFLQGMLDQLKGQ